MEILDFKSRQDFKIWLEKYHKTSEGREIFLYKKGYQDQGLNYEDAVQVALCYGWIDAVTHSYNEEKFSQYFAPRKKTSNWSLSNIKRMKALIESGQMTEEGLKFFDMTLIDQLDNLIEKEKQEKEKGFEVPMILQDLLEEEGMIDDFEKISYSQKKNFIYFILDAKKEATKIRRCQKVIGILKGEKNNL